MNALDQVIARAERSAAKVRAEVEDYRDTRNAELRLYRDNTLVPRLAELDAEVIALRAVATELSALRSESEAVKAERATAIEAMLKTLHESSSDYEAALESARSESEALRRDKERLEAISVPGATTRVYMNALENMADPPMRRAAEVSIPSGPHAANVSVRQSLREAIDAANPAARSTLGIEGN